jgi:hypothetical protein
MSSSDRRPQRRSRRGDTEGARFVTGGRPLVTFTAWPGRTASSVSAFMLRSLALAVIAALLALPASAQNPQTLAVPADSPRWDLQGDAKVVDHQGHSCIVLDGGVAVVKGLRPPRRRRRRGTCRRPSAKSLVWRGTASKTIDPEAKPQKQQKNLAKAVAKMPEELPAAEGGLIRS